MMGVLASIAGILARPRARHRPLQALRRGRLHAAEQRPRAADADDRRRAARRHRRHAARQPAPRVPRDARAADLGGARGRDAAAGTLRALPHAVGDRARPCSASPRSPTGIFGSELGTDAGARVHGPRHAADLLRRRAPLGADRATARVGARLAGGEVRRRGGRARARQRDAATRSARPRPPPR